MLRISSLVLKNHYLEMGKQKKNNFLEVREIQLSDQYKNNFMTVRVGVAELKSLINGNP